MPPFSCPEKELYFRRSNKARNWRRNNFKVVNTVSVPSKGCVFGGDENKHIVTYDDFYLHWENIGDRSCEPDSASDDSEPNIEFDSEPDGEPESEPDGETESEADGETESKPDGESESEPDGEPDCNPDSKAVSKTFTWQFVWADLLRQDGLQVGSLTRPVGSQIDGVLAANSKVTL